MPRGLIQAVDIGRQPILAHALRIGVATRAQFRRLNAELRSAGILNVVDAVAIGADRHIGIVLFDQRLAMHAVLVDIVDILMALAARLGNARARLSGRLYIMRTVAIRADRRIEIAGCRRFRVHTIHRLVVVGRVTLLARFIVRPRQLAPRLIRDRWMGEGLDVGVARFALDAGRTVHRRLQTIGGNS